MSDRQISFDKKNCNTDDMRWLLSTGILNLKFTNLIIHDDIYTYNIIPTDNRTVSDRFNIFDDNTFVIDRDSYNTSFDCTIDRTYNIYSHIKEIENELKEILIKWNMETLYEYFISLNELNIRLVSVVSSILPISKYSNDYTKIETVIKTYNFYDDEWNTSTDNKIVFYVYCLLLHLMNPLPLLTINRTTISNFLVMFDRINYFKLITSSLTNKTMMDNCNCFNISGLNRNNNIHVSFLKNHILTIPKNYKPDTYLKSISELKFFEVLYTVFSLDA